MLKKIFIFLILLFILAGGALAFFIVTFDADKHKPTVIAEIEKAVGHPVDLAKISLTWKGGIALGLDGLAIYPGEDKTGKPSIELESASALLRIFPLLRGSVEMGSIKLIRPAFQVRQERDGTITIPGVKLPEKTDSSGSAGGTAAGLSFLIDSIEIEKGALLFTDYKQVPPLVIALNDADIKLEPISLTRPVNIEADARFLSEEEQNLHFKGRLKLPGINKPARLEEVRFETDLSLIDLDELARVLPKADLSILKQSPNGKIKIKAEQINLDENVLATLEGEASLTGGGLSVTALREPLRDIDLEVALKNTEVTIKKFDARLGNGSFSALGKVSNVLTIPEGTITANFTNLDLGKTLVQGPPQNPQINGIASGNFQGSFRGNQDYDIKQSLTGSGVIRMNEAKITNFNLLNEVITKISAIPGLGRRLNERLSEEYKQKLTAPETVFSDVELPIKVERGAVELSKLDITSDGFNLTGAGYYGLTTGSFGAQTMLSLDQELSSAFIRSVQELSYLTNEKGWLQIPIRVDGNANGVKVLPDLQYIGTKLASFKAQELLSGLLGRGKETTQETQTQTAGQTTPPANSTQTTPEQTASAAGTPVNQVDAQPRELSKEEKVVNLVGGLLNSFLAEEQK